MMRTRLSLNCARNDKGASPDSAIYQERKLKPERTLTRMPDFDGYNGDIQRDVERPARNVAPAAMASAVPAGVIFGPMPNSAPPRVRIPTIHDRLGTGALCSSPPTRTTHSVTAVTPPERP